MWTRDFLHVVLSVCLCISYFKHVEHFIIKSFYIEENATDYFNSVPGLGVRGFILTGA